MRIVSGDISHSSENIKSLSVSFSFSLSSNLVFDFDDFLLFFDFSL